MENITYGTEVATEVASTSHAELALEARYRSLTAKENDLSEREAYLSKVKAQIIQLAKSLMGDDVIIIQREDFDNLMFELETAIANAEESKAGIDDLQSEVYDLKRCVESVENSADDASSNLDGAIGDLGSVLDTLKGLA